MIPYGYGYVLQLKVSFKMGPFSDTQHTLPGIFILESPPVGWLQVNGTELAGSWVVAIAPSPHNVTNNCLQI